MIKRSLKFQFAPCKKTRYFDVSKLKSVKNTSFVPSFKIRKNSRFFLFKKFLKFVKCEFSTTIQTTSDDECMTRRVIRLIVQQRIGVADLSVHRGVRERDVLLWLETEGRPTLQPLTTWPGARHVHACNEAVSVAAVVERHGDRVTLIVRACRVLNQHNDQSINALFCVAPWSSG